MSIVKHRHRHAFGTQVAGLHGRVYTVGSDGTLSPDPIDPDVEEFAQFPKTFRITEDASTPAPALPVRAPPPPPPLAPAPAGAVVGQTSIRGLQVKLDRGDFDAILPELIARETRKGALDALNARAAFLNAQSPL